MTIDTKALLPSCDERGALSQPAWQPAPPANDLPLIARRASIPDWATHAYESSLAEDNGELIPVIPEPELADVLMREWGEQLHRIADNDEHGLPVIERTTEMPEGATHKITWLDDGEVEFTDSTPIALEANRSGAVSERIEDYNAHAEPAQREGS